MSEPIVHEPLTANQQIAALRLRAEHHPRQRWHTVRLTKDQNFVVRKGMEQAFGDDRDLRIFALSQIWASGLNAEGAASPVTSTNHLTELQAHILIEFMYGNQVLSKDAQLTDEAWQLFRELALRHALRQRNALIKSGQLEML